MSKKILSAILTAALLVTPASFNANEAKAQITDKTAENTRGRKFLSQNALEIYDILKAELEKISSGERTDTEIDFTLSTPISDENDRVNAIVDAADQLLSDYPELSYWCAGYGYTYFGAAEINVSFYVEDTYKIDEFKVDSAKIDAVQPALEYARSIAAKYAGKSDYEKIMGYSEEICALNEYNEKAAEEGWEDYEPWDLIYVFDGDPDTNVVCEGYAKAFHYLCALGGIECYCVSGSAGGPHMWNIVVLDGISYHVDVTNCDGELEEIIQEFHPFVLIGAKSSSAEKAEFDYHYGNYGFMGAYIYSEKTRQMYPEELLAVSTKDYDSGIVKPGTVFIEGDLEYTVLKDRTLSVSCPSENKEKLTNIDIPSVVNDMKVTKITKDAFRDCPYLESVTIPEGVTEIDECAFFECISLTSVIVPKSIISIGFNAFGGTPFLNDQKGVKYAGHVVIGCDTDITSVEIRPGTLVIADNAFMSCKLESIVIPEGITTIGTNAFMNCSIVSVSLPESVTSMAAGAFVYCTSLSEINVDERNACYCSENGVLFNKNKTLLLLCAADNARKIYEIPESVTKIEDYAFCDCFSLEFVKIPESVTEIGRNAFEYCKGLTSVSIPSSVVDIASVFYGCDNLKDVYYAGSEADWNNVFFNESDLPLNVTIHYNSTGPTVTPIEITVKAPEGTDISCQTATATGNGETKPLTITDGMLDVSGLADGKYTFTFKANNCAPRTYEVTVSGGTATGLESGVKLNLFGDINGDGKLTLGDVLKANASARNSKPLTGYDKSVADINEDGKISLGDVLKMNAHARNSKLLW